MRAQAKRGAELAPARVDLGGMSGYELNGSSIALYSGEGLLLKLAKVGGRLLVLTSVWECGDLLEEHVMGKVEG